MKDLDIQDPQHRKLARLILARRDIRNAQTTAKYVLDNVKAVNDWLFEPLTSVMVISYARPFVSSRGYARLPKRYEMFPSEPMKELHTVIMDYRNHYVAHSDADFNRVMLVPKGADISWANGKSKGILISHGDLIRTRHLRLQAFQPFSDLCTFQLQRIEEAITEDKNMLFA